jgi:hypothetical protein
MKPSKLISICVALPSLIAGILLSQPGMALQGLPQEPYEWTVQNYNKALNELLSAGRIAPEAFPKDAKWIVTVRIVSSDKNEPEIRISLRQSYDGTVVAEVLKPRMTSLFDQLLRLRRDRAGLPAKKLFPLVGLEQFTVNGKSVPELNELATDFEKMRISPVLPDVLMLDAVSYEFWSQSMYGNLVEASLVGPGPSAPEQPHELLRWAERLRSVLLNRRAPRP